MLRNSLVFEEIIIFVKGEMTATIQNLRTPAGIQGQGCLPYSIRLVKQRRRRFPSAL
jgi:hypothetical protein